MPDSAASVYRAEYARRGRIAVMLGATDEQLADLFDIDMETLAFWAWKSRKFFNAITPTSSDRAAWIARKAVWREAINRGKRANLARNPSARVRNAVAARLWASLRGRSDGRLFSRLGYSVDELRAHIERQFSAGMSWDNYGQWHIDHRRPCASFDLTNPEQFAECWGLANLQPLWASENIRKGAKWQ